jgi:hypothetical protein
MEDFTMSKTNAGNEVIEKEVMENEIQETTAIAVSNEDVAGADLVEVLKNPKSGFYCSIVDDGTRDSKIRIYNAINSTDKQLSECFGEVIELVAVAAHPVKLLSEETGEINECLRAVLIDKNGVAYQCVSEGVISSLQRIYNIVGTPDTWGDEPLKVKAKNIPTKGGKSTITLQLV